MRLAIFYHHVRMWAEQQRESIDTVLDEVRALGIRYLEVDRDEIGNTKLFDAMLTRHDLGVSSIYGFYDWGTHPEDFHDLLQLDQAQILKSPEVMFIPGLCSTGFPPIRYLEQQRMLKGLQAMTVRALEKRLVPTIEDFDNSLSPIATMEGMKKCEDRIEGLKTTLDTGNFFYSGQDVLKAMDYLDGSIWHVHLKDRRLIGDVSEEALAGRGQASKTVDGTLMYPSAVGRGIIPVRQVLDRLHSAGYRGSCAMEFFGAADYKKTTEESVAFLKETGYFDL